MRAYAYTMSVPHEMTKVERESEKRKRRNTNNSDDITTKRLISGGLVRSLNIIERPVPVPSSFHNCMRNTRRFRVGVKWDPMGRLRCCCESQTHWLDFDLNSRATRAHTRWSNTACWTREKTNLELIYDQVSISHVWKGEKSIFSSKASYITTYEKFIGRMDTKAWKDVELARSSILKRFEIFDPDRKHRNRHRWHVAAEQTTMTLLNLGKDLFVVSRHWYLLKIINKD